jgi:hypothetical protein
LIQIGGIAPEVVDIRGVHIGCLRLHGKTENEYKISKPAIIMAIFTNCTKRLPRSCAA